MSAPDELIKEMRRQDGGRDILADIDKHNQDVERNLELVRNIKFELEWQRDPADVVVEVVLRKDVIRRRLDRLEALVWKGAPKKLVEQELDLVQKGVNDLKRSLEQA
jgi:hypothetical protein